MEQSAGIATARGDAQWPNDQVDQRHFDNPLQDLRLVGVGGVLDGGFDLLKVGFNPLVALAAILILPWTILDLVLRLTSGTAIGPGEGLPPLAMVGILSLALSFLGMAGGFMASELLAGREPRLRSIGAFVASRWWVALLIPLMAAPIKGIAYVLCILPLLFVAPLLMCASSAAGAEQLNPFRALLRGASLARANYSKALFVFVGAAIISLILNTALLLGPIMLSGFVPTDWTANLLITAPSIVLLVSQPLTACIAARAYVDFRCASEGLDLALRRDKLGLN